jgi:hypothetical protein
MRGEWGVRERWSDESGEVRESGRGGDDYSQRPHTISRFIKNLTDLFLLAKII